MMANFQFTCWMATTEVRCSFEARHLGGLLARGPIGSKAAQVSIFWTGGVGVFGAIGFAGIMDNILPRLALPGVLQRGQAADCS